MEIIVSGTQAEIEDFIDCLRIIEEDSCYKIKFIDALIGIYNTNCYFCRITFGIV